MQERRHVAIKHGGVMGDDADMQHIYIYIYTYVQTYYD